jgi:hypothetical protein
MRRSILVGLMLLLVSVTAAYGKPRDGIPSWVATSERQLLASLGNRKTVEVFHIPYSHKIAVVFEFQDIVVCRFCSAPTAASLPRGRVLRVSFDRATRRPLGGLRFCEVRGLTPPLSSCLRR